MHAHSLFERSVGQGNRDLRFTHVISNFKALIRRDSGKPNFIWQQCLAEMASSDSTDMRTLVSRLRHSSIELPTLPIGIFRSVIKNPGGAPVPMLFLRRPM
ncbi:hypothetical protein D3870_21125 [Noviherbaspirillum cavernae]|uniref:Uncharacterized protein n=1 Tax=Noviherbaspirillum cavernae TaxID=2320862 RepID=A0A418WWH2_9BURK|nr:hypothetical protein [Noviherbaspirillum cavernae]RJF96881.1 hypothetical protein D3870_21125 [Noviherbaspirillum cavernae]